MADRLLVVVADDYGIGPATSQGIIQACRAGVVTGTVLLVNSPFAESAVENWNKANVPADLGWHPCLTIDAPILPASQVPSLVNANGRFHSLGGLMARLAFKRVRYAHVVAEFRAQLDRFRQLTGTDPAVVNTHHHIQVFSLVQSALRDVLSQCKSRPFVRRVCEPFVNIAQVPGARIKRMFLSTLGRRQSPSDFSCGENLAGITDPPCVHDPRFFTRWLRQTPGQIVELTCHPGNYDETLLGRDAEPGDGHLERRVRELELLLKPEFLAATHVAGFRIVRPSTIAQPVRDIRRAAG